MSLSNIWAQSMQIAWYVPVLKMKHAILTVSPKLEEIDKLRDYVSCLGSGLRGPATLESFYSGRSGTGRNGRTNDLMLFDTCFAAASCPVPTVATSDVVPVDLLRPA